MGNILFTSQIQSAIGETYKIDLFSESYIGLDTDLSGGTGSVFYLANDWTDFLTTPMSVTIYWNDRANSTTANIVSFTYNEAQNRTEITLSIAYVGTYEEIVTNLYYPTFEPKVIEVNTEWDNQGDILLESIKASSTTITYANNDAWFDRFIEMYIESTDNELKLIMYKDNSGWELEWVGNIVIDLVEWDNISKPTPFTIKAIDGLDKLKDISYDEVATSPTETSLKEHLYNLLAKNDLNQFWGVNDAYLRESIEYLSNEVAGTVTDHYSPLDYCFISDRMFINKRPDDNTSEGISCYEALRGILELFNCRIFISKGVYYIQQIRNYDNTTVIVYREYAKTMGSYARGTYQYKLTAGPRDRSEDLVVLGGGKFAYLAGLYKVSMDVKANLQSEVKLDFLSTDVLNNPDTFTETFDVYGGVGSGAILRYDFQVSAYNGILTGDYLDVEIVISVTDGASTYYYTGGRGLRRKWVTSSASFGYDIKGLVKGSVQKFTLETLEIPLSGTLTLTVTATAKDYKGATKSIISGTAPYGVLSNITLPLGESSNNALIESYNPSTNYTKELQLPPLVITDFSNSTSVNVISVKEDYLTTNTTLVKSETWGAGFDSDTELTNTRVLEAMSLQTRPISRYLGSFEGQYYPHNCIVYNNKTYFFNGLSKNYKMDEVDGEWVEQTNNKAGITPTEWKGNPTEGEIYTGDGNQSGLVALLNNNHTVSAVDSAQAAGAVTSLSIVASGLSQSIVKGDKVLVIDPITNGIIEEFTAAADLLSTDTTLSVESKTTTQDIEAGMVFQVAKETIFEKINMAGKDFMLEVAKGNIAGTIGVNIFGLNLDSANGVVEDVWEGGGTYPYPTTAAITQVRQATNQAAMQGATIRLKGLDVNWDIVTQDITLDVGDTTTPTALTTALIRLFSAEILADVVATSNIEILDNALLVTYGLILTGKQKTEMALYTIPSGYTGYLIDYSVDYAKSSTKNPDGLEFGLWAADRENGYEFMLINRIGIADGANGIKREFNPYKVVTEKTDIKVTSEPSGKAAHVHAAVNLLIVENA